jgi:hypothetical protein
VQTLSNLTGTVSGAGLVPITTPTFKIPRTLIDQATINQNPVLFTIDPDLRTPYVQQWNVGVEREFMRNAVASVRYVGNHGVKQLRGIDINQVRIFENSFLQDFQRAQRNLELSTALNATNPAIPASPAFNAAVPGSQQLTIIPLVGRRGLFTTATGSTLDSAIVNFIRTGQAGELVQRYVNNRNIYLTPGVNGAALSPGFFLPANARAGNVDYLGNGSYSNYNALQAEMVFRLRNGFHFQTNYTWSKGFNDFEGSDSNFAALLDLSRGELEKSERHPSCLQIQWDIPAAVRAWKKIFEFAERGDQQTLRRMGNERHIRSTHGPAHLNSVSPRHGEPRRSFCPEHCRHDAHAGPVAGHDWRIHTSDNRSPPLPGSAIDRSGRAR